MFDVVDMFTKDFNVNKYQEMALKSINEVKSRDKLPIVVGGTNYYIESLMYERNIEEFAYDKDQFDICFQLEK